LNVTFLRTLLNRTAWLVRKGVAAGRGEDVAAAPGRWVQGAVKWAKILTTPLLVSVSTVIQIKLVARMGHEHLAFSSRESVSQSVGK
jgi:hypothetical protein